MSKVPVTGVNRPEVYKWLTLQSRNCVQNATVTWNFQKFLIERDGSWYATKTPGTSPMHSSIVNWITADPVSVSQDFSEKSNAKIFNNIANQSLHFSIRTIKEQTVRVNIYSITGQLVAKVFEGNVHGIRDFTYPSSNFGKGMFIVEISGTDFYQHKKVMLY